MNDLVLDGFVKNFAEGRGYSHLKPHELFEAFAASSILRKYHQADIPDLEESVLVGGSGDGGMDAVAVLVNGRPARTEEDVQFFVDNLRRLDVEFVFVQAKVSPTFDSAEIGNFVFGIEQFLSAVEGTDPKVAFNSDIGQLVHLTKYVYAQSIKMQKNPKCFFYYATSGKWTNAPDPRGRLADGEDRLRKLNIFSDVRATPIDAELLKAVYRELERGVVKQVEFSKATVFPRIDGVDDAYIGLLPGNEFIKMVTTDDGDLNGELFYDNVRDFQGSNPVNGEINHTLSDELLRYSFPLLNNGITIVAKEMSRKGDTFTISDFQIVNGCQTTHMIFQNRGSVGGDTFVPVKLVATRDRQIITEVIKATNRQTAVLPEALESLTPFHRELEDFYGIRESTRESADRIYYERRSKQYARENISPKNIVSLTTQIKSFIGMFLNEPHSHPRYYGELLRAYEGRLFGNDHRPEPYYASGVALLTVERWLNSHQDGRDLRSYRHQLLMLVRTNIGGQEIPRFNSSAISEYSLKIVDALRDPDRNSEECQRAADMIRATLSKFGTRDGERNPPHRLRAFTERLLEEFPSAKNTMNGERTNESGSRSGMERGRMVWFDEWRNYGFIARLGRSDIFVHGSELGSVPWHLRLKGTAIRFQVVDNPKSPGMQMASRAELDVV